jgi:predicted metalloprotease
VRWRKTGGDDGVQDLRGSSGRSGLPMGRIGGGAGGLGVVGIIIVVLVTVLGGGGGFSPGASLDPLPGTPAAGSGAISSEAPGSQEDLVQFVRFVVGDVEDSWSRQ